MTNDKKITQSTLHGTMLGNLIDDQGMEIVRRNSELTRQYRSERGHLLLSQTTQDKPILTLEAYCKWYEMHLLHPDGTVTEVDSSVVLEVAPGLWIDHNYHPKALLLVAKHLDAYFCELSLEVAAGRCVLMGEFGFEDCPLGGYFLEEEDESTGLSE